jgi:P-type Mg2+ transporter
LRDGTPQLIPAEEIVLGDIVLLSAGSLIPADGIVLEARDFFVDQAVLTGETFPVEKKPGPVQVGAVGFESRREPFAIVPGHIHCLCSV